MDTRSQQQHDLRLKGYIGHILVILEKEISLRKISRAIIFCGRIHVSSWEEKALIINSIDRKIYCLQLSNNS